MKVEQKEWYHEDMKEIEKHYRGGVNKAILSLTPTNIYHSQRMFRQRRCYRLEYIRLLFTPTSLSKSVSSMTYISFV